MPKKNSEQKKPIRQPIVAVMGHVDHGKTTFLDSLRGANVADKEHGGITQNTRAHEVVAKNGFKITFIDTPGHEAFAKMRERGARVTDFVLLMVAADDGLQPQTKQSIEFAKENNVPIIVCINKVDIEGVQIQKIKQELSSFGVQIEEYGGDVLCFEISAKNKTGLDNVLEGIELLSEINNLSAHNPKEGVLAEAFILESSLDKTRGYSALAILKSGKLDGKYFGVTAGSVFKSRAYINEQGKNIDEVYESQPFTILGLKEDLKTGEIVNFVKDEDAAKELKNKLVSGTVTEEAEEQKTLSAEELFTQMLINKEVAKKGVEQKELKIVLKTSTQGTLEAVIEELNKLETEQSKVKIVQSGSGPVNEDDVNMAKITHGIVISFQVDVPSKVLVYARTNKVLLRHYEIIYELIDEIADVLDSLDQPIEQEVDFSKAEIVQVFTLSDGSQVAGCKVTENKFIKGYQVKILDRKGVEKARVKIVSVRQGKNEVKEVKKGMDCGLLLSQKVDNLEEGDQIVAYRVEKF